MTRRQFQVGLAGLGISGCGGRGPAAQETGRPAARGPEFHRGVNFTAEWPDKYASPRTREMLRRLPEFGVDSVALVPYGFCRRNSPEIRFHADKNWERDADLGVLADVARDAGMRVLLKPQIWVPRGFPGDLDFEAPAERATWFRGYEAFLRHYAGVAVRCSAEILSVGVEFSRMVRYEEEWRKLIGIARDIYRGRLVYAANWGAEFETVGFWGDLDYIGLNNYYPLPEDLSMDSVVATVERVHRKAGRPVLFPETGFPSLVNAHREPWADRPRREISLEEQARCYEASFEAFYHQPWFHGLYWWKVGSNGFGGPEDGSHTPWNKPAMDVIARWYRRGRGF